MAASASSKEFRVPRRCFLKDPLFGVDKFDVKCYNVLGHGSFLPWWILCGNLILPYGLNHVHLYI